MNHASRPLIADAATTLTLALVALSAAAGPAAAQGRTDTAVLEELSRRFALELERRRPALYHQLLASDVEPQRSMNHNPDIRLMYIDDRGVPVFYGVENLTAARTIRTDDVWPGGSAGFSLSGSGTALTDLGVWDAGAVRASHQELSGRTTQGDSPGSTHWHATHVAGTMIAGGVSGGAKGMSYQGRLTAFDWNNDASEMATAAANGMEVSNHSYGLVTGWYWDAPTSVWYWYGDRTISTAEDYRFGFYDGVAQAWDQVAAAAPFYTIVKSAGNDHQEGPAPGTAHWHWQSGTGWVWSADIHDLDGGADGFDCIPTYGVAKNIITVGAVQDIPNGWSQPSDVAVLGFSGRGFADDGRIKPDLVANGDNLYSCTDAGNNTYGWASGTSMATPSVAGSVNLLVRHWAGVEGGPPLSSTMKAILIQTADEAGANPGPDYTHGWGLMNTTAAAQFIQSGASSGQINLGTVDNGTVHVFEAYITGGTFKATLCWTDPAGTPPSASLNPTTPILVSDLDVRLVSLSDGTVYLPWVLDSTNPGNAATTGDNILDNVEQIHATSLPVGGYRVTVTHKGTLASPQIFSLVSSETLGIAALADHADHNVGNVVLTMTDHGTLGFRDDAQTEGSGFVFPAGGSNLLYIGGLWVSQGSGYVAARDYGAEPEQEWEVSTIPDGHVVVTYGAVSDQDIRAGCADAGATSPRGLLVRQQSWAWSDPPDDDFIIVRYRIENTGSTPLTELFAGVLMDYDIETYTANTGGVASARHLAYLAGGSGVHAGLRLLGGSGSPDSLGHFTLIHNPTYVWPQAYIPDADKIAFLQAADSAHVLLDGASPDDYGVLASAGPFDLAPGDTCEVAFAIVGGTDLQDLLANADRAKIRYTSITQGPAGVVPSPAVLAGLRLLSNAPNPFLESTAIRFHLDRAATVTLALYDVRGREVRVLVRGGRESGVHTLLWDGFDASGRRAAGGVYFLRLFGAGSLDSRRIVRLR